VSRGESLGKLATDVIAALKAGKADSIESLRSDAVLKMGENIRINSEIIAGESIGFYIHTNGKVAAVVNIKVNPPSPIRGITWLCYIDFFCEWN
jgi:translation elongation factor EF-Ts